MRLVVAPQLATAARSATIVHHAAATVTTLASDITQCGRGPQPHALRAIVFAILLCGGSAFTPSDKAELKAATDAWVSDASAAEATYGHISGWDTSLITDMSWLFCGAASASSLAAAAAGSFAPPPGSPGTSGRGGVSICAERSSRHCAFHSFFVHAWGLGLLGYLEMIFCIFSAVFLNT